ncbi:DUF7341 domain-containing protein [Arthrobacter agilis]|uniref:DUF7341 domain-containing protein n=1 Tax=Arthrobacter agilis TaxID=37921 RepID=UPI002782DA90|nr:hypothetical protein [Arthrobacter agilis]MDQ0735318.1 hypothetical protein [Arthrobacter agilis]
MDALTEVHSNVHQLTREHTRRHKAMYRVDGELITEDVHGTVPSLLDQLRKCIGASAGGNTGGAATAGLPLDVSALNLLEEIKGKCAERYQTWAGVARVPTSDVEGNLRRWVAHLLSAGDKDVEDARLATAGWVSAILAIVHPQRSTEIVGACPHCGWAKQEVVVDGETKICSVLIAVGGTVTCQSCAAQWEGEQLHWLRDAMSAKVQENDRPSVVA